jgi:cation diffusion facilitator CzcD-associated flavoprotein CzcO
MDDYDGQAFHSARWRHDVTMQGKRIAVIGTGASAVQFVPAIVDDAEHVTVFQRTPQWIMPKPNIGLPGIYRSLLRRVPVVDRLQRGLVYRIMEGITLGTRHASLMSIAHAIGRMHIRRQISDRALRSTVTPDFVFGCKRPLFANTWYPALDRADVTVRPCGVASFTRDGVVGTDGVEVPADVVIFGTGFRITDMPVAHLIRNGDGVSLEEHWQGSPRAYLGTTTHGFPNFAVLLGPGLGTLASAFTVVESQLTLLRSLLRETRARGAVAFDTRTEVEAAYNAERSQALESTVYQSGCESYFFDKTGANSFSWPWSTDRMRSRLGAADPGAYDFLVPVTTAATSEPTEVADPTAESVRA